MTKLNVFVACPYTLPAMPLDDYKGAYERVQKASPVTFRFADEQITSKHILDKITNYIREADFCLFDVTGWNANVALELGVAHGLNRKYFIALNTKIEGRGEPPSDLRGIDRINYTSLSELEARLIYLVKQEMPKDISTQSAFDGLRSRIQEYLEGSPNQRLQEIVTAVGEDKVLIQPALRAMVASGELSTAGANKGMRYRVATDEERSVVDPFWDIPIA